MPPTAPVLELGTINDGTDQPTAAAADSPPIESEIQRYLERAAFDAARKPGVVIVGSTSAETVAALEAWIAGGGKGTVLGPVSVAMAPAK